ncbi:hypothetical protein CEXT_164481 [Caerostris extrusa]|uniref:Uncharacterized protein n=1 Tax=Caerostris extrusa TaxID=172846 RepID=A0AAV4P2E7_CAEEX|nr:hypothetical protein CEXT_164481 [Caerostris extrusa]
MKSYFSSGNFIPRPRESAAIDLSLAPFWAHDSRSIGHSSAPLPGWIADGREQLSSGFEAKRWLDFVSTSREEKLHAFFVLFYNYFIWLDI